MLGQLLAGGCRWLGFQCCAGKDRPPEVGPAGHNLTQPSPAQWPSKTHWAGLGQDDFVSANELAILTCQGPAR